MAVTVAINKNCQVCRTRNLLNGCIFFKLKISSLCIFRALFCFACYIILQQAKNGKSVIRRLRVSWDPLQWNQSGNWRKGKWSPGQPPQKLRAQPLIEKEVIQASVGWLKLVYSDGLCDVCVETKQLVAINQ